MDLNLNILNQKPSRRSKQNVIRNQSQSISESKHGNCYFCNNAPGRYVCPQCAQPYCSTECFRNSEKHFQCSEHFFKKMVFEHLKQLKADKQEKLRFLDFLKRKINNGQRQPPMPPDYLDVIRYLENDDDYDNSSELEDINFDWVKDERITSFLEKMSNILQQQQSQSSDEESIESIWSKLSLDDQNDFVQMVNDNLKILQEIIPNWQPWWLENEWYSIVVQESDNQTTNSAIPKIYNKIEPLCKLTQRTPCHKVLSLSILCTCFSYCHLIRLYNGEISKHEQSNEILCQLLHLAPCLQANYQPPSTLTPLSIIEFLQNRYLTIDHKDHEDPIASISKRKRRLYGLLSDIRIMWNWKSHPGQTMLIQTMLDNDQPNKKYLAPKAILLALSDLLGITSGLSLNGLSVNQRKHLKLIPQKLKFYLSFSIECLSGDENQASKQQELILEAIDLQREKLAQEENIDCF